MKINVNIARKARTGCSRHVRVRLCQRVMQMCLLACMFALVSVLQFAHSADTRTGALQVNLMQVEGQEVWQAYSTLVSVHGDTILTTRCEQICVGDLQPGRYVLHCWALGQKHAIDTIVIRADMSTNIDCVFVPECAELFVMSMPRPRPMINHWQIGTVRTIHIRPEVLRATCEAHTYDCDSVSQSLIEVVEVKQLQ